MYVLLFLWPFITQIYVQNPIYFKACNVSCLLVNLFLFAFEVIQLNDIGKDQYFGDLQNINDFSQFFVYIYYFVFISKTDQVRYSVLNVIILF